MDTEEKIALSLAVATIFQMMCCVFCAISHVKSLLLGITTIITTIAFFSFITIASARRK